MNLYLYLGSLVNHYLEILPMVLCIPKNNSVLTVVMNIVHRHVKGVLLVLIFVPRQIVHDPAGYNPNESDDDDMSEESGDIDEEDDDEHSNGDDSSGGGVEE
jgi:hypothetical protein